MGKKLFLSAPLPEHNCPTLTDPHLSDRSESKYLCQASFWLLKGAKVKVCESVLICELHRPMTEG